MIPASDWKPTPATLALALLVLWAPLPFASVTPTGLLVLRLAIFTLVVLLVWTEPARPLPGGVRVSATCLLVIAFIGALQAMPLPGGLVGLLSPERLRLAADSVGGEPGAVPLSLTPGQSLSVSLTFVAMAAALVAGARLGADRRGRAWLLGAVLVAALFQLLYGFRHLAAGSNAVWGREVGRAAARMRGTYVNSAHLAPFLEIALVIAFALLWWGIARSRSSGDRPKLEVRIALVAVPALIWLLVFTGLAFTRSRAGLAAAVLATVAQGVLLAARARRWRLLPVGLLATATGIGLVAWVGLERGLGRLLGTSAGSVAANDRFVVWEGTLELWRRFPFTGTGLGSFEASYSMVESPEVAAVSWQHAHNDWLELLSMGGAPALAAAILGAAALMLRLTRVLIRSRGPAAAAALAGLGAMFAVGLHELLDFGLTLPANAFALAVVLGVAAAGESRPQANAASAGRAAPPE